MLHANFLTSRTSLFFVRTKGSNMLNHGDPLYEFGHWLYRKRGNEVFVVSRAWERMKASSSLAVRLEATWKKIERKAVPDIVLGVFGLKTA